MRPDERIPYSGAGKAGKRQGQQRHVSDGEVIREALRALQQRDQLRERELQAVREKIHRGLEQLEHGEFTEYDEATVKNLAEEVKAQGRQRLADESSRSGTA